MDTRENGQKLSRREVQPGDTLDIRWETTWKVSRVVVEDITVTGIKAGKPGETAHWYRLANVAEICLVKETAK